MGELNPIPCTQERWLYSSLGACKNWPWWHGPRRAGSVPPRPEEAVLVAKTDQFSYQPHPGPILRSAPKTCWSVQWDWYCRITATGSPWLRVVYPRGISLRVQWWWHVKGTELNQWFNAMNILYVAVWTKECMHDILQLPVPLGWLKRCWEHGGLRWIYCWLF